MRRCWFGLGLLIFLLIGGLLTTGAMTRDHEGISARLNTAATAAFAENWAEAAEQLQEARQEWENNWHFAAVFADHAPMEDIDGLFTQAEIYLKCRDSEAMAAICAQLACMTEAVGEAHALNWWNLL